jgi:hypothetical protein
MPILRTCCGFEMCGAECQGTTQDVIQSYLCEKCCDLVPRDAFGKFGVPKGATPPYAFMTARGERRNKRTTGGEIKWLRYRLTIITCEPIDCSCLSDISCITGATSEGFIQKIITTSPFTVRGGQPDFLYTTVLDIETRVFISRSCCNAN